MGKALGKKMLGDLHKRRAQQESTRRIQENYPRFTLAEKMGLVCNEKTFAKLAQLEQVKWDERKKRQSKYIARERV